jgi:hypothetical protein
MLKPIRVGSCLAPLAKVYQYQYTGDRGGDLGFAYVFWFIDCAPARSPYKVAVRRADSPLTAGQGYSSFEASYIIDDPELRIFKLTFDKDSMGKYTLTGGETVTQCLVCD